jgi:DNA-binding MarR family transcriptional regulator
MCSLEMVHMEDSVIVRIGRVRKALRREFETRAEPMQITVSQLHVLRHLWKADGVSTSALTQDAGSDGGTVTGILDRLESRQLIRRERSTKDRRTVLIWLTPQGRALQEPLMKIMMAINEQALAGLSVEEKRQLKLALDKVVSNLDA